MRRGRTRQAIIATVAALAGAGALTAAGISPLRASATTTTYYFHGTATDDACRAEVAAGTAQPCATFDTTAPTSTAPVGSKQTAVFGGNANQSANALSIYWYGPFSGTVSGDLYLDLYASTENAETALLGDTVTVTVYEDPNPLIGTSNTQLVQQSVALKFGTPNAPVVNHALIPLPSSGAHACPCTVKSNLLIQVTSDTFVDTGHGNTADYDTAAAASSFHFGPPPPPPSTSSAAVSAGVQAFANYESPSGFETRDAAQRPSAGEPSLGSDWTTGKIVYYAGTQASQVSFDTSKVPPAATWNDVTPASLSNASEDSILFTNHSTNRTWAENFLLNPACNANMAYTDTDGGAGGGPTATGTNTAWTPEQCPFAEGPDHPSVGAGPYHGAPPATATDTAEIVYYCSQNVLVLAGAECTASQDGGLSWGAPAHLFGTGTPCDSIHGHIRVSPDGTMYVPQGNCGGKQGMAVSQDNGSTFTYAVVPDSLTGPTDPSVAADRNNTIYFGYQAGNGTSSAGTSLPMISVSNDHGATWSASVNVGAPLGIKNVVFPEVIAGDPGRAAFAFLGTTTSGDYQQENFGCPSGQAASTGCSSTAVWDLYVAYTYDGGTSWTVVDATPTDPVQRGCVDNGGATGSSYGGCRNMLDFNDITVDQKGRVYVAYTDGCTPTDATTGYSCETNPALNDSTCNTSSPNTVNPTYSESSSIDSYATCTYARRSALVRQVCGQGLFAAGDPGFSEGPSCALAANTPEAPTSIGLMVAGAGMAGLVGMVIRRRRSRKGAPAADLPLC